MHLARRELRRGQKGSPPWKDRLSKVEREISLFLVSSFLPERWYVQRKSVSEGSLQQVQLRSPSDIQTLSGCGSAQRQYLVSVSVQDASNIDSMLESSKDETHLQSICQSTELPRCRVPTTINSYFTDFRPIWNRLRRV